MQILISNATDLPIYRQITQQIKNAILRGELAAGEPLPSIRTLAKDLRISVITTKRAYDELEKEGLVNTVASRGCYVAPQNAQLLREANLKKIEEYMSRILDLAPACGLTGRELAEMLETLQKEGAE